MSDQTRHLLHALEQLAEDRHDALSIANSASMFLIDRCDMVEVNPLLGFYFLRHLCDRNIENQISQAMELSCKHGGIELTDEVKAEMQGIVDAMEEALLHGLQEKEVSLGEMS